MTAPIIQIGSEAMKRFSLKQILWAGAIAIVCLLVFRQIRQILLPSHIRMAQSIIKKLDHKDIGKFKTLFGEGPKYYLSQRKFEKNSTVIAGLANNISVTFDRPGYLLYVDLYPDYDWEHPIEIIIFNPENDASQPTVTCANGPVTQITDPNGIVLSSTWTEISMAWF